MAEGSALQRAATVAPLITALTVLTVAVVGGIGWVNDYFAKEREVERRLCVLALRAELAEGRSRTGNLYAQYLNAKTDLATLPKDSEQWQIREGQRLLLLKQVQQAHEVELALSERLKKGPCEKWEDTP